MNRIRRWSQAGFLILFLAGVALAFGAFVPWSPLAAFIRLDPLLFLGQAVTRLDWPPGLLQVGVLVGVTLVLGRIFCSHICPLGTTLDLVAWLTRAKRVKRFQPPETWRRGKYIVLIALIVAAFWGVNLTHWGAPLSLATRLYALVVWPFVQFVSDNTVLPGLTPPELVRVAHSGALVLLLGGILGLSVLVPRFWCRYLCPAGALLAFLGRWSLVRRVVGEHCTHCGRCAQQCPVGIGEDGSVAAGECLNCGLCAAQCPEEVIGFQTGGQQRAPFWPRRRQALGAALAGTAAAFFTGAGLWAYRGEREKGQPVAETLVRPPGALSEEAFLDRCVRCGACLRACPTNMLHPQWGEQSGLGAFAPLAVARRGPCEPRCTACGEVCPTGAIRSLPLTEKLWAKMGTARLLPSKCLAWEWDRSCLVCDEACPFGAIDLRREAGQKVAVPFILEDRCTGCGACEHACPVQGQAAIQVTPMGALRLDSGSFRQRGRQIGLDISRTHDKDRAYSSDPRSAPDSGQLPPGFSS